MKGYEFLDKLMFIDGDLIEAANEEKRKYHFKKKILYAFITVTAACFLLLIGTFSLFLSKEKEHKIQQWADSFCAEDYFKYNDIYSDNNIDSSTTEQKSIDTDYPSPYEETRFFSERKTLEEKQIIPIMEKQKKFICSANYLSDGSLYSLIFTWDCREDNNYSSLSVTCGYQEPEMPVCDTFEVDENGIIIEPNTTITERDNIQIIAKGNKNRTKTLTFQNEYGFYQIEGSWNDSYEDMVILLDWFWKHPIDFQYFPIEKGDNYTYINFSEYPDAFSGYLPDIAKLGYETEQENESVTLKNGEPCSFDGNYISPDLPRFSFHITKEPDYYEQQESIGDIKNLTLKKITDAMKEKNCISFTWDQYFISIYINSDGTPELVWNIIKSMQMSKTAIKP